jgi:hypothetical protein
MKKKMPKFEKVRSPESHKVAFETEPQSGWTEFVQAWRVFAGDYQIVNHPDTPDISCFDNPNLPTVEDHRQYTRTIIPADMAEAEFLQRYQGIDTILISCMDKDAVGPNHQLLTKQGKRILLIAIAGGIIQKEDDRQEALKIIIRYLGQNNNGQIKEVYATDHDHTCGYVKAKGFDGVSLSTKLGVKEPIVGKFVETEEDSAMEALINHYTDLSRVDQVFPGIVKRVLVRIDRNGNVVLEPVKTQERKALEDI